MREIFGIGTLCTQGGEYCHGIKEQNGPAHRSHCSSRFLLLSQPTACSKAGRPTNKESGPSSGTMSAIRKHHA